MKKIILLVTFIGLVFQSIAAKTLEGYENYKPQKVYVNVINATYPTKPYIDCLLYTSDAADE